MYRYYSLDNEEMRDEKRTKNGEKILFRFGIIDDLDGILIIFGPFGFTDKIIPCSHVCNNQYSQQRQRNGSRGAFFRFKVFMLEHLPAGLFTVSCLGERLTNISESI